MDTLLSRHRNVCILVAVLFLQVLGLAVQVKRSNNTESTRLLRLWAVSAVTPFEKALVWTQQTTHGIWHNYFYLRGVRQENRDLKQEIERLRLEQVRLAEDAEQARRLQQLLGFKEKFISKTQAAQVIGLSGSEHSRSIYIDKGSRDGIETDQAVITSDGVVGKVFHVFDSTAQVLLVNDQTSGVGVILQKSRLQGVLRGKPTGQVALEKILNDNTVEAGEEILTSGGDQIFPKGLPVGTVMQVRTGADSFLDIRVKPAANLSKLEEVLVVTKIEEKAPSPGEVAGSMRAVDILTQRLPSVPDKPAVDPKVAKSNTGTATAAKPTTTPTPNGSIVKTAQPVLNAQPKPAGESNAVKAAGESNAVKPAAASAKPTVTNGTMISPSSIKPAVIQKPAAPIVKTPQQSAPATTAPKPDASVEDKPQ
jgi:rod shape-determining protein MreC